MTRKGVGRLIPWLLVLDVLLLAAYLILQMIGTSVGGKDSVAQSVPLPPDPEVVDYGVRFIHIVTPFYLMICFNQIYSGALRGIGDATAPTVIMLCSFVVFRQIYLAVTKALNVGFIAVALAYPMGWIMCSTLLYIRYRGSKLVREL